MATATTNNSNNNHTSPEEDLGLDLDLPFALALAEWDAAQIVPDSTPPSAAFLSRATEIARKAQALRLMRQAMHQIGFKPLPLPDYVAVAANKAQVNLGKVIPISEGSESPATPWVKVAWKLGMDLERIRLHLRLWVADRFAVLSPQGAALARGKPGKITNVVKTMQGLSEEKIETALTRFEADYSQHAKDVLDACLVTLAGLPQKA